MMSRFEKILHRIDCIMRLHQWGVYTFYTGATDENKIPVRFVTSSFKCVHCGTIIFIKDSK